MQLTLVRAALFCAFLAAPSLAMADPPSTRDADAALDAADRAGRRLLVLLDQTRVSRDLSRISCVDQRLSQVNSFARTLAERGRRLREAAVQGDEREVAHQRRVLGRLVEQLQQVEREGRACVYPEANLESRTIVTVTIDASIRHQDLSIVPVPPR